MNNDTGDTVVGRAPGSLHSPRASLDLDASSMLPTTTPAVYRFRIGGLAEPISLDRPARIGRRPAMPRVVEGVSPRLVRVVSPQREVSATHLEVRQIGVSVVITDLRSTNGTVVLAPGSIPRKLLQGESIVVSPGTLVDIGDENILQILPLDQRRS